MDERDKILAKRVLKYNARSWHELHYDEIRNKPYLIGRKKPTDELTYMYVMDPKKQFRFNFLRKIVTDTKCSSVLLNIHGSDSTSVYYKLSDGLPDVDDDYGKKSNKDSSKSDDEISHDEMSSDEDMPKKHFGKKTSKVKCAEEKSVQDSNKEATDKTHSPQTITILD